MAIYFGNNLSKEPFQFDTIGHHWMQENIDRPNGFPRYHYLQTEKGCGIISLGEKEILLEEGMGILITPFVPHSYRTQGGVWLTAFATFGGMLESYIKVIFGSQEFLFIGGELGHMAASIIDSAVIHFQASDINTKQASIDCYQLLMLFTEGKPPIPDTEQHTWQKYVKPVVDEIEEHYMEDLSAGQLARQVFISPQYLSRLFGHFFDCSVYEYVTNYRINKAKEFLLLKRNRKVQDIAHDVGYTDSSHFIVMFRQFCGMTPMEFRKLHF